MADLVWTECLKHDIRHPAHVKCPGCEADEKKNLPRSHFCECCESVISIPLKQYNMPVPGTSNPIERKEVYLCRVCAGSFIANKKFYADLYWGKTVNSEFAFDLCVGTLKAIHALVDALDVREKFEENLKRDVEWDIDNG